MAVNIDEPEAETPIDTQADLIVQCLIGELSRASPWTAKVAAWNAILAVRRQSGDILADERRRRPTGSGQTAQVRVQ